MVGLIIVLNDHLQIVGTKLCKKNKKDQGIANPILCYYFDNLLFNSLTKVTSITAYI